jgi:hypothetical protein
MAVRTLIYIPILHTSADLGSLSKEVTLIRDRNAPVPPEKCTCKGTELPRIR